MMRRNARVLRKALVVGVLCLFAFAQVAIAGEACRLGSGSCPLPANGVAAHDHGHHYSQVCALQTASAQSFSTAASSADVLDAIAPATVLVLALLRALEMPRPLRGERIASAALLLVTSGRLRL